MEKTEFVKKNDKNNKSRYYIDSIKKIRLLFLALGILYTYGISSKLIEFSSLIFSFVPSIFFIFSGYLVLRESDNMEMRILRAIGRTAICFVLLFVIYLGLSLWANPSITLSLISQKSFWIDFLLLNICNLPIGATIWYVQSLLYAYIIAYIVCKLKLLRFDFIIAAICLVAATCTGEFSSLIKFNFLGHTYLSSNFITRALPYVLIGSFIHRKNKFFLSFNMKHYIKVIIIGFALLFLEYFTLKFAGLKSYCAHMLGTVIVSVGICMLCFFFKWNIKLTKPLKNFSRFEFMIPYYVCSPIYYLLIINNDIINFFSDVVGLLVMLCSFSALYIYIFICKMFVILKHRRYLKHMKKSKKRL